MIIRKIGRCWGGDNAPVNLDSAGLIPQTFVVPEGAPSLGHSIPLAIADPGQVSVSPRWALRRPSGYLLVWIFFYTLVDLALLGSVLLIMCEISLTCQTRDDSDRGLYCSEVGSYSTLPVHQSLISSTMPSLLDLSRAGSSLSRTPRWWSTRVKISREKIAQRWNVAW